MKNLSKWIFFLQLLLLTMLPGFTETEIAPDPASNSIYQAKLDIFDVINVYRSEKNLSPLIFDTNLSFAAQNQADYLLEIRKLSSKGPNSESIQTMVSNSGYGGGAPFHALQLMAAAWEDTKADYLIQQIWGKSTESVQNLSNNKIIHIGIGIADKNKVRYIDVILGYLDDGSVSYTPLPTYDQTEKPYYSPTPTPPKITVATANPDGSIKHLIKAGETFSEIALAYGIDWYTLSTQNHLDLKNPIVIEGQKLIIRPAFTITPTPTASRTPHPPTRTPRPTYTSDLQGTVAATLFLERTLTSVSYHEAPVANLIHKAASYKKTAGIILVAVSLLGLIGCIVFPRRKKSGKS